MDLNRQNGVLAHFGLDKMEAGEQLSPAATEKLLKAVERAFKKTQEHPSNEARQDFLTLRALCAEFGIDSGPTTRRVLGRPEPLDPAAIRDEVEAGHINAWARVHLVPLTVEAGKVPVIPDATREQIQNEVLRVIRKHAAGSPNFSAERVAIAKQTAERLGAMPSPEKIRYTLEGE